ncbi:hypothetical protein CD798_08325 [Bacillaceae bacterium SAOS 7]|nr:hypothetical protein CD798_08325 [Bacillaceae bacterium SAOS 7]
MFETLKSLSAGIVTWLGIVLTIWFAYYTFRYQLTTSVKKEQLHKVYLPMFKLMEPFLYKNVEDIGIPRLNTLLNELDKICEAHYELVEPRIISYIKKVRNLLSNSDYDESELNEVYKRLCSKIDFGFESTRKRLGLPVRNAYYKLDEVQYEDKFKLTYYIFLISWKNIAFLLFMYLLLDWLVF